MEKERLVPSSQPRSFSASLAAAGGESGRLIASRDWTHTALGPIDAWSQSLKTALGIILLSPVPIVMLWGADGVMLYNDAYSVFAGARHPSLLGSNVREGWPEVADFNDHVMKVGLAGGTLAYRDHELTLYRHGRPEQVWMNLDYSPVPDEHGVPAGVIAVVLETTERVLAERRQAFLLKLEEKVRNVVEPRAVLDTATEALGRCLGALRVGYAAIEADGVHNIVTGAWQTQGAASILGRRSRLADDSGPVIDDYMAGRTVAVDDVRTDPPRQGAAGIAPYEALGVRAQVTVPLVKGGRLMALLFVHAAEPRRWAPAEIGLIQDVAERTWGVLERARAEGALRANQNRQALLLALSASQRETADPAVIMQAAASALGAHLRASRVGLFEVAGDDGMTFGPCWTDGRLAPCVGTCPAVEGHLRRMRDGPPATGDTAAADPLPPDHTPPRPDSCSGFVVPIIRSGQPRAGLLIDSVEARTWTADEHALAREAAALTWDAVERARAQRAVRWSEERFRALVTASSSVLYRTSPAWDEMWQIGGDDFLHGIKRTRTTWLDDYVHPEDRAGVRAAVQAAIRTRSMFQIEHRIPRKDGTVGWIFSRAVPILGADGAILEWFGAASDVTARKQAEECLRASEEQLRLATDAAEIALWDVDRVTDTLFWPPRLKRMFGISPDVPVSMADFYGGLHPEDKPAVVAAFAAAIDPKQRSVYDVEYRTVGKEDGVIRWVAAKGRGMFDSQGRCVRALGTAIDITARKAAEARLRELNETLEQRVAAALAERKLLADIVDGTDVFVQVADRDFRWLAINRAAGQEFERIFGVRPPRVGDNILDMLAGKPEHQAAARAIWSRAFAGEAFHEVVEFGDPAFDRRYYEMRFRPLRDQAGAVVGAYQFVYDVTQRLQEQARLREAETALQQVQKMEAVGRLTGGIAHDFNNLLQGVIGSLDLIRRRPNDSGRVARLAESGLHAAERGSKLTGQLLAFSRAQRIEAKPLHVAGLLTGMLELLQRTLGPLIRIMLDVRDDGAAVLSDSTQLEMAVLNLAINARDAVHEQGEVTLGTRLVAIADDPELDPGTYVELRVSDNGVGMSADVAARAFDPFFTTKPVGKGTGLGLSQVYGIARQSGGTARIDSAPGRGTTVRLLLRCTGQTARAAAADAADDAAVSRRKARVLVIDDDNDVRQFLADSLESLGHGADVAADGPSGLAMLDRLMPDVMVVDFAMPGMNGAEVARAARQRRPELPIIFASGYSETAAIERVGGVRTTVLRKPFRVDDLAVALADVLPPM